MSYDIRLAVRVDGAEEELFAIIDLPELSHPTYNLGRVFRACTGWDFDQGRFYRASEVLPMLDRGIRELTYNEDAYRSLLPPIRRGSLDGALETLCSLRDCVISNASEFKEVPRGWNKVPLRLLYVAW